MFTLGDLINKKTGGLGGTSSLGRIQQNMSGGTSNSPTSPFPDRDWNFIANLLKDVRDTGQGLGTLISYLPEIVSGKADISPIDLLKGVVEGYKTSYGQQDGFNAGNLAKSFYMHPLNIADMIPAMKVLGVGKILGKTAIGARAIKAFDSAGDTVRIGGSYRPIEMSSELSDASRVSRSAYAKYMENSIKGIPNSSKGNWLDAGLETKGQLADKIFANKRQVDPLYFARKAGKLPVKGDIDNLANRAKGMFTTSVLTQPSWPVGNLGGNVYFSGLGGVGADDIVRGAKLDHLMPKGLKGSGLYGSVSRPTTGIKAMDKWGDLWFNKINAPMENAFRKGAYIKKMKGIATDSLKSRGINHPTNTQLTVEIARAGKNAKNVDASMKFMRNTYGDYRTLKPYETHLGAVAPFYKWFRESSKIMSRSPVTHPASYNAMVRTPSVLGSLIGSRQNEALAEMGYTAPDYMQGGAVSGIDDTGSPIMRNLSRALPTSAVGDLASSILKFPSADTARYLAPYFTIPTHLLTGTNFTGTPATAPGVEQDFRGNRYTMKDGEAESLYGSELPESERIPFLISEILRSFTPLGSVERVLPYKSYDTRMFQPNPDRSKVDGYYLTNLGLGSRYRIPKTKSIRVKKEGESKKGKTSTHKGLRRSHSSGRGITTIAPYKSMGYKP